MTKLLQNFSLQDYNTFGIDVKAAFFVSAHTVNDIQQVLRKVNVDDVLLLSGGSNILFTTDFNGVILHPQIEGIEVIDEDNNFVNLKVGAGVVWDSLVEFCVNQNYCGIENLSLIPGWVGACPIQNIGAYGVEVKDVITKVDFLNFEDFRLDQFDKESCDFGYRDSIFKRNLHRKGVITHVYFRLNKKHRFVLNYGDIERTVKAIGDINLPNVRNAVISIREAKLPDTREFGNAGSFFKNPEIEPELFLELKQKYADIPGYNLQSGKIKIPAAWLIEQAGFKGKRIGNCGTHVTQPLVIVNYGRSTGADIVAFSESIKSEIKRKFEIQLHTEVNII